MSMNLTATKMPCPHCKRGYDIDLAQTPTADTYRMLYRDYPASMNYKRPWQETRDLYIEWYMKGVSDHSDYLKGHLKGKALARQRKADLEYAKGHCDELRGDDPIEFGFI